jgi:uncharacterized protein
MDPTLWWVLAILLIVVGVIGTFLPGVPGTPAMFGGMLLAAWIDNFSRIGWITLIVLGVLAALAFVVDIAASVIGAQRVGASRLALIGAAVGAVIGLFFGIVGILIAPFIGAVAGELLSRRSLGSAARVGVATWIGLAVASIAKAAIVFAMLGTFMASYLIA